MFGKLRSYLIYPRPIFFGLALASASLISAYLIQYFADMQPCSLCLLERWIIIGMGLCFGFQLFLYQLFNQNTVSDVLNFLSKYFNLILNLSGILIALRHVWIERFPETLEHLSCTADLDRLFEKYNVWIAIKKVIESPSDCGSHIDFFLGISVPTWSLITFLVLLIFNVFIIFEYKKESLHQAV
ncbi:MAG: disulfide bond formation protein B [Gammaproteobacteria bacterium]